MSPAATAVVVVLGVIGYLLVGVAVSAVASAVFELGDFRSYPDWIGDWFLSTLVVFVWPIVLGVGVLAGVWFAGVSFAVWPLWFGIVRRLNPRYADKIKQSRT